MQTWEYATELRKYMTEAELNELGAEGWELIAVHMESIFPNGLRRFIFKRPAS
jgi:hypothetical protein